MRCKSCHYPLTKLPEHRCPECGRAFDPGDASTWELEALAKRRAWTWVMLVTIIVLVLFLIAVFIPVVEHYLL